MKRTDTIVIGGGQAGLAMSRSLAGRGIDHVVLERGRVGERWRSERRNSLRLLTPRWQSRLPGWSYRGADPDGFMTMPELIRYLEEYARSFSAPVVEGVTVRSVKRDETGFRVDTDSGRWQAPTVVIATGYCDQPRVPRMAENLPSRVAQMVPARYQNPESLPDGGVLIVGASATGVQLASEIARSGHHVTLATGQHLRLPRHYRGRDILAWFDAMGIFSQRADAVQDIERSRAHPSMQLVGSDDHRSVDLGTLQDEGVRVVGRVAAIAGWTSYLGDDLPAVVSHSENKMTELLDRVDRFIEQTGIGAEFPPEARPRPVHTPESPLSVRMAREGIRTVLWATGYRREYPWLHVPVLDQRGELMHEGGVTPEPGLYALGLNFMRRRNSNFLDGVGADAGELADHIDSYLSHRLLHAA